jgi:hypothetical protein
MAAMTPVCAHRLDQLARGIPNLEGLLELRRIVDVPSGKSHCNEGHEGTGERAQSLKIICLVQTSCRTGSR